VRNRGIHASEFFEELINAERESCSRVVVKIERTSGKKKGGKK